MTTEPRSQASPAGSRDLLGHPRGLAVLATTEMWEVFSFMGMKTLLIYYMTKALAFPQAQASVIYGLYGGFAYFTPLLGGIICDRWLTRRQAVIAGGLIMAIGHFMLLFPPLFFASLITLIAGVGLYLPALPSQVAELYAHGDRRRESAFSVYYMGMNTGALLAPLVCGALGELVGWHWGFGVAGCGMLVGVAVYVRGARLLPAEAPKTFRRRTQDTPRGGVAASFLLIAAIASSVMVFRGAYEQLGNTVALWLDKGVDRQLGGFTIPMTWFQAFNPLLVIALTPGLIALWAHGRRTGREPRPLIKMTVGAGLAAVSFLMLAALAESAGDRTVHWLWVAFFVVVLTIAELHVLPVTLSVFNRMAPAGLVTTATAFFFSTGFGGHLLGGFLGVSWSQMSPGRFFVLMAAVAAVSGLCTLFLDRPVRKFEAKLTNAADPDMNPRLERP